MVKFKSKYLEIIHEVGSVSVDIYKSMLNEYIQQNIKTTSNDDLDVSLIRWLCNVVENSTEKKNIVDSKIDKKQIVIDEYLKLKTNAQHLRSTIERIIEDLHNTKQIKRVSTKNKLYYKIKSVVFSSDKK